MGPTTQLFEYLRETFTSRHALEYLEPVRSEKNERKRVLANGNA